MEMTSEITFSLENLKELKDDKSFLVYLEVNLDKINICIYMLMYFRSKMCSSYFLIFIKRYVEKVDNDDTVFVKQQICS